MVTRPCSDPINIEALATQHSLAVMQTVAPPPLGRRRGNEYQLLNPHRDDKSLGSFSINLQTSLWADFAIDKQGYSFTALIEYLYNLSSPQAVTVLGGLLNQWEVPEFAPAPLQIQLTEEQLSATSQMQTAICDKSTPIKWDTLPISKEQLRSLHQAYPSYFQKRKPDHVFQYKNAAGELMMVELRWDSGDGKMIRPAIFGKPNPAIMAQTHDLPPRWVGAWPQSIPLKNSDLIANDPDKPVLIVEGAKTCNAATKQFTQYVVGSVPGGGMITRCDLSVLSGREVFIWPDADEPGIKLAHRIREKAIYSGCKSVAIINLPTDGTLPKGWDLADEAPDGFDPHKLLSKTISFNTGDIDMSVLTPLKKQVTPLPLEILPSWGDWLDVMSKAKNTPKEYLLHTLIGTTSGLRVGRSNITARAGWTEPAALFMVSVGGSSAGKSPAFSAVESGIHALEKVHRLDLAKAQAKAELTEDETHLFLEQFRVMDATIESLAHTMSRQSTGLLLWQPEMSEFINSLQRYNRGGSDRGFWLRAWDCLPGIVNRKSLGSDPMQIDCLGCSIVGGIQPDVLSDFNKGGLASEDGLIPRMMFVYPDPLPVKSPSFNEIDYLVAVKKLNTFISRTHQQPQQELILSKQAHEYFESWRLDHLQSLRDSHRENDAGAHKAPGQVLRLSLSFHLLEACQGDTVSLDILKQALNYRQVIDSHHERIKADILTPRSEILAMRLGQWVIQNKVGVLDTVQLRKNIKLEGLRSTENIHLALCELHDSGWIKTDLDKSRWGADKLPRIIDLKEALWN